MNQIEMELKLVDYLNQNNHVSFVEIERLFRENQFDYEGDRSIVINNNINLLIWDNWNDVACNIINRILALGLVRIIPTIATTYAVDCGWLNIPIAKQLISRKYKNPHWLPVVFCKVHKKKPLTKMQLSNGQ